VGPLTINSVDPDGGGDSTAACSLKTASPINLNQDFWLRPTYSIGHHVFADLTRGNRDFVRPGSAACGWSLLRLCLR